ncbi:MAG: UDP-glucose 4-epimerase GalE [Gammaproteobacteria bacterium]|nr:UDP-glucose 4-epimerase GalE [Gammaproteobacteria bacterium]
MRILVTGGMGYIGSHFIVKALELGHEVTAIDNLCNSSISVKSIIEEIAKKEFKFFEVDLKDKLALANVFKENTFDCVVHFAGLKSVAESKTNPIAYYANNVTGSLNLFEAMNDASVQNLIFSSSATVYGGSDCTVYTEDHPKKPVNNYGHTKLVVEQMLENICLSAPEWSVVALRYFNPIGAHPSGKIGENPRGVPNNLMPYITKVASGEYEALQVFGNDYGTPDKTGVRDYIHVMDLVEGHLAALDFQEKNRGFNAFNLGTGKGFSVLEVVKAFEQENQIEIPLIYKPRRDGDLEAYWADPSKAKVQLCWQAKYELSDMVRDAWRWQNSIKPEPGTTQILVAPTNKTIENPFINVHTNGFFSPLKEKEMDKPTNSSITNDPELHQ